MNRKPFVARVLWAEFAVCSLQFAARSILDKVSDDSFVGRVLRINALILTH